MVVLEECTISEKCMEFLSLICHFSLFFMSLSKGRDTQNDFRAATNDWRPATGDKSHSVMTPKTGDFRQFPSTIDSQSFPNMLET